MASYSIADMRAIAPFYAAKLKAAGIRSTAKLLERAAYAKTAQRAREAHQYPDATLILDWANIADLTRVPGIALDYAELLFAAGVDTVQDLGRRNAANLVARMIAVNAQKSAWSRCRARSASRAGSRPRRSCHAAWTTRGRRGLRLAAADRRTYNATWPIRDIRALPTRSKRGAYWSKNRWRAAIFRRSARARMTASRSSRSMPPAGDVSPLAGRASERWTVVQTVDDPDPERANEQALADLKGGAAGLVAAVCRIADSPAASGLPSQPTPCLGRLTALTWPQSRSASSRTASPRRRRAA